MTTIRSDSMYPLLFAGDRVRVSRLAGSEARPGDLVLFLDLQGGAPRLVAHRVLSRRGGVLRTKGDANLRLDPPLPESAVLGRVEAVATFGRLWELDLVRARRAGRLAAALAPALYAARRFIGTGALFALRRAALSAASRGSAPAAPGALDGDAPFFGFLSRDETWSGRVCLAGDVFVPPGVTLTLEAGTVLLSEPESLWSLLSPSGRGGPCALHLAGRLEARGRDGARVCLGGPAPWGGLRLRPGAEAVLAGCDAGGGTEAGVFVAGGARLTMDGCVFDGAGAGVRLGPGAEAALRGCVISGADGAGVLAEAGARLSLRDTRLERCATGLESRGALVALAGTCSTGHAHRGALVTGGRLEAESCRFDGNGGEGLLLAGGALAVVSRSGAADNRVGLAVNGADLTAVGFEARDNEDAGVDLAGGRARLTSVAVAGGLHGLRVSGGEAEVRALSLAECDRGVVVAGGSLRLDGAGVPVGALEAGPGGRASVGGSATGHAGPGVARRALLAFVVATRDLPGFAAAYAGLYALAARAAVALARRDAALASVLAHRSWATGRWRAGTSDLDLVVVLRGLEGEEGWRRLSALWRGFGRLRRLFPALGELLVLEPEDLAAYLREGGPRGRVVLPAQARVLYGAPLPGVAPGPPPDAFERFGEKAHAYTRLMVRLADSGATPRAAATALASKALEELGVAASPRAPAELRDAGARAMTAFHQEALALLADLGGPTPPEATLTRRAPPPALPGERRRFAAGLETLQARLDGALAAACTDTLYRSYLVLEDEAFEPRRLSVLLERLAGAASPLPAASTVPVVLSWSAWTLWTRLPYLECPHLGAELSGAAPGEAVVARAGRAFAAARRFAWSRRPLPGLRLDPETTARRDRECLATLRATWRFHASPAGGHSPAYALHYLYTRTMGLRLLLERGERVPFFELDEAAARFRVHFPEEMTGWEQRWRAFPARLDAPEMAAHAAWLDRQLRGSSRVPPK